MSRVFCGQPHLGTSAQMRRPSDVLLAITAFQYVEEEGDDADSEVLLWWGGVLLNFMTCVDTPIDRVWVARPRCSQLADALVSSREIFLDINATSMFRMSRFSFSALLSALAPRLTRVGRNGLSTDPSIKLAVFLYFAAHGASLSVVSHVFGVGISTASKFVHTVARAIQSDLGDLVSFPRLDVAAAQFQAMKGVPQCIGVIDGTHIPIKRPVSNGDCYFYRKNWYSVVLQGVVDWRGRFCDVTCMWPGRVADARVFRTSPLGMALGGMSATGLKAQIAVSQTETTSLPYYLLGDSAYPNTEVFVTTYEMADIERDVVNLRLNKKLSSMRYKIECAFGQLKGRWRSLLKPIEIGIENVAPLVLSLCILQNFLFDRCDEWDESSEETQGELTKYNLLYPQPTGSNDDVCDERLSARAKLRKWYENSLSNRR